MNKLIMIEHQPHQWRVMYPKHVLEQEDFFQEGLALHNSHPERAEKIYRQIMVNCGELYLDAVSHLGMLLNNRSQGLGTMYLIQAYTQARLLFLDEFEEGKDFLLYDSRGNAFVLTAYYAMANELMKVKKWKEALDIFVFLVKINPKDNHGAGRWIEQLKQRISSTSDWQFLNT